MSASGICYQVDCRMKGDCQRKRVFGPVAGSNVSWTECRRLGYRIEQIDRVGPPLPPPGRWWPTMTLHYREAWTAALVYEGERFYAIAWENRHLSYRECAVLAGMPDHGFLGYVARNALQIYCNHAERPFPLRKR